MTREHTHIYSFNYDIHYSDLCKLESRQIFGKEFENKLLFSDIKIDPSISPFLKSRFDIIFSTDNYFDLLKDLEDKNICEEGFKVEYLVLDGDETSYHDRLQKLKGVGYSIQGEPDYVNPSIIFAICCYEDIWFFGVLVKHNPDWQKHLKKPCSFSNSIGMTIAKTLVSIASSGDKNCSLIDACCGVGTVMLEACFAGFLISGCDVNWKACKHTRDNLTFYNYAAEVYCMDINEMAQKYDAAIVDLPYNLYSYSNDDIAFNIISSSGRISPRVVIVSIKDIKSVIEHANLKIVDFCTVEKRGKSKFARTIWVCEN